MLPHGSLAAPFNFMVCSVKFWLIAVFEASLWLWSTLAALMVSFPAAAENSNKKSLCDLPDLHKMVNREKTTSW